MPNGSVRSRQKSLKWIALVSLAIQTPGLRKLFCVSNALRESESSDNCHGPAVTRCEEMIKSSCGLGKTEQHVLGIVPYHHLKHLSSGSRVGVSKCWHTHKNLAESASLKSSAFIILLHKYTWSLPLNELGSFAIRIWKAS